MTKKYMNTKIDHILNCAMTILKESGDQGLSMRKIAEASDMSLSNVQYYFKTKELLLAALLEGFLSDYAKSMHTLSFSDQHSPRERLEYLIFSILSDIENNDCAVVFKELWAIAERNSAVKKAVDDYYKKLNAILFDLLRTTSPENCQEKRVHDAVAMLLPFIEGYCITSSYIGMSTKKVSEKITLMLYALLCET